MSKLIERLRIRSRKNPINGQYCHVKYPKTPGPSVYNTMLQTQKGVCHLPFVPSAVTTLLKRHSKKTNFISQKRLIVGIHALSLGKLDPTC